MVGQQYKYRAFLSYSHRDKAWGHWLHAALESYRIDHDLIGCETVSGRVPKTLRPIFRDREDFSAGHSLTEQTLAALRQSQFLIVLCSPSAAQSKYVNEEIRRFKALNGSERVIPVIVGGTPGSDPTVECFPPALRHRVSPEGVILEEKDEPLAADARPDGDGKQFAKQKTIAGLLGLPLDEIVKRAERARKRTNAIWAGVAGLFLALTLAAAGSATYAYSKLLQSEERLDSAIEIAYGFVSEATDISDRFGVPTAVSLGLLQRAEAALNTLIANGADTASLRYRKALMLVSFCDNYERLGQTNEAEVRAGQARDLLRELATLNPDNVEWQLNFIRAEIYVGVYQDRARRVSEALETDRRAATEARNFLQRFPQNADAVTYLARALVNVGLVQASQGSTRDAAKNFSDALSIMFKFANGSETDTDVQKAIRNQPTLEYMFNEITDTTAQLESASGSFQRALDLNRELLAYHRVQFNPGSVSNKSELTNALLAYGNSLMDWGLLSSAHDAFVEGLKISQELSASDPENISFRKLVALLQDGLGRCLLAEGDAAQALQTFKANLQSAEGYARADAANIEWIRNLGIGHERIGDALMALGDWDASLAEYNLERDIMEELLTTHAEDVGTRVWLAKSEMKIGEALFRARRWEEAEQHFGAAIPTLKAKANSDASVVEFQAFLLRVAWRKAELGASSQLVDVKRSFDALREQKMLNLENKSWLETAEQDPILPAETECFGIPATGAPGFKACETLIESLQDSPIRLSVIYRIRGDAYLAMGNREQSKADYQNVITIATKIIGQQGNNFLAYNNRGLAYHQLGNYDEALADFSRAISLNPTLSIAYSNRGLTLQVSGKPQEALKDFTKAIDLDQTVPLIYANRAGCHAALAQWTDALNDLDKAVQLSPREAQYYNLRGVTYFQIGNLEKALQDFTTAIDLVPNNPIAFTNRGRVYERQGLFEKAISEHDTAIRLNDQLAIAFANRGLAHEGERDYDDALKDFEHALAIDPKLERALQGRARLQASVLTSQ